MMNDVRDHVAPVETTGKTEKIIAAAIVAVGFAAVGVFAYETQGMPQPKVAAVHEQAPPAPLADVPTSLTPPQSTAEVPPLPDLPAAAPAAKESTANTPAKTASQPTPTPSVRVARAPSPAPQAPAAPPPAIA